MTDIIMFIFLFFLIRLPLRSTLFPYTTLFRSVGLGQIVPEVHVGREASQEREMVGALQVADAAPGADRKSTRLNSSHTVISYAVFCLKKKTKKHGSRTLALYKLRDHYGHKHSH